MSCGQSDGYTRIAPGMFAGLGLLLVRIAAGRWRILTPDGQVVADNVEGLDLANKLATEHARAR